MQPCRLYLTLAHYKANSVRQDNQIKIQELRPDGHLQDVATKADFGSNILCASVFGDSYKGIANYSYPYSLTNSPDPFVKQEDEDDAMEGTGQVIGVCKDDGPQLPPQILILTLECGSLIFLFANDISNGPEPIRFFTHELSWTSSRSFLETPGRYVAVDPK